MDFITVFRIVQQMCHQISVEHGFWDTPRNEGECIALMHSELSEALEAIRNGNPPDRHCPQFSSLEIELADTIIRIMDFAHGNNLNVPEALLAKINFNKNREHKHGKSF